MKKLEVGTILKDITPRAINISLNGNVKESDEKDITYYQIEDSRIKQSKFGYKYIEYVVFNLTKSKYTTLSEMFIYDSFKQGKMEIIKGV